MKNLKVCVGDACHSKGAYDVINIFQTLIEKHEIRDVEVQAILCMGQCDKMITCCIDDEEIESLSVDTAEDFFLKNFVIEKELS